MSKNPNIKLIQCGQERAYGDSIYAGTIRAESEQQARDGLQEMRGTNKPILDKQDRGHEWSRPYFTEFREVEPGLWKFRIVEEYTG